MASKSHIVVPKDGNVLEYKNDGTLKSNTQPIIPYIEGDGSGPELWKAAQLILDRAVAKAYKGKKKIHWMEVYAGEKACTLYGKNERLPDETLETIKKYTVALKGPLSSNYSGSDRSLAIEIRQKLDLYASVRPIQWFPGVYAPVKLPTDVHLVIFRENSEDSYAGIEFKSGAKNTQALLKEIQKTHDHPALKSDSSIGIKPISPLATQRLVRKAIQYAVDHNLPSVTLVHKGTVLKHTEGAFVQWGYELAKKEFGKKIVTQGEVDSKYKGKVPKGRVIIKDVVADTMFQEVLLNPGNYSVIVTPNVIGDHLSDTCGALVGGPGMVPSGNFGDTTAMFEAVHGTAPDLAGKDAANPGSVILSGMMLLEYLGWNEAVELIINAMSTTFYSKKATADLARFMPHGIPLKCSEFADLVVSNLDSSELSDADIAIAEQGSLFNITEDNLESGLRKVPVGYCQSSFVNPDTGVHYAGYAIDSIAYKDPEEVIYLLFNLKFPSPDEYTAFKTDLQARAGVKQEVLEYLMNTPMSAHPMQWLTAGLNALAIFTSTKDYREDSLNLIAQLPEIVAAIFRTRSGWGNPIRSRPEMGYMENFAYMLGAPEATEDLPELMRIFNVLHFDHGGGNLSTLVGKAVASGHEDVYGSLISAMCALAGPLHGMANQNCLSFIKTVLENVPDPDDHDQLYKYIEDYYNAGGKVSGFGHAVLRKQDPRATILYEVGDRVGMHDDHYRMARSLKKVAVEFLQKQPKVSNPYPNVDAISGSVLTACGLKDENYYTLLFGLSRCVGIAAQIVYERTIAREGKGLPIMRPRYIYCGPRR